MKILVIDDDKRMLGTLTRILRGGGHETVETRDGAEALRVFNVERPDIVVCDIMMPEKEGIETILELRQKNPSLLILAISGGSSLYLELAQKLGADGALAKPFQPEDLLREIDKLLPAKHVGPQLQGLP